MDTTNSPPTANSHETIGITIDPIALIVQECITITSAMRRHPRWAQSSVSTILGGSGLGQDMTSPSLLNRSNSGRKASPRITREGRLGSAVGTPGGGSGSGSGSEDESTLASRWGLRSRKNKSAQDNPLLVAFARLRRDLAGCRDVSTIDAPTLLHPFLQVIRSSSTTAAITSLAITSITKFFSYNLITIQSPRVGLAVHLLNAAITNCRYEAGNITADEVALLRLLRLMEVLMCRPEGKLLSDEDICNLMSTGLSMCCQSSHTEFLRRSAEMSMTAMCQVVFGRLKELEIEPIELPVGVRSRSNTVTSLKPIASNSEPKMETPVGERTKAVQKEARLSLENNGRGSIDAAPAAPAVNGADETEEADETTPYALLSIKELFRVLIDLLDPHKASNTESMRVMALRVIDTALEVAGPSIAAQPKLAALVEDDLCRHLFQLVRSENLTILNSSLRVAGTLLATCRQLLKLQQELFLSYLVACLHPRVDIPREPGIDPSLYEGVPQAPKLVKPAPSQSSSGRSTPVPVKDRQKLGLEGGARRPEAREAMVETIGTLVRMPNFMTQLFVNYDCEVDRQDLCEDMVGLLSRNAFPDAASWSTVNVPPLCLDSLLCFLQSMAERLHQEQPADTADKLLQIRMQRHRKRIIKKGATKFNDDPRGGVAYLKKNGMIENEDDPVSVAKFLKGTSRLSKKQLGDFITKKSNEQLLIAFIGLFDFQGKRIDEALREMLASFRLPGEAPLIARIVEVFTEKYCATSVDEIANTESAYVLTYAIIMLNTDQHNPNVKGQKRMAVEDFARNLRGTNDGKDFDPGYLQDIYDAIRENEIILPDEHDNKHAFDYAWKELLMKTHDAGQLDLCPTNAYDAEIFAATWKPIIATLCYVFMSASDDAVFSRVVVGFDQCAQIAAKYGVQECFDRIVYSLSQVSSLATEIPPSTSLNTEVQAGQKKIMVSELAVRLGRDFRAQLATVLLFRILNGNESGIKETWTYIVRILRNLFVNSLITLPTIESKMSKMDPVPLQPPSLVVDRDGKLAESGLFSTFTSYLSSYAADDPPEPSEEELENTLSSVDCVKACHCDIFLTNILKLPTEQIAALVKALLSQLPDEPSPVVVVKTERPMPVTARVNGHRGAKGPEYHPGPIFLLELATLLALRDETTLSLVGEEVTTTLQNAVRDASNLHSLAASRIALYLLDMLRAGFTYDFMRAPVVLHAISSFDDSILDATAANVMQGLATCISEADALRNDITTSPDFWSILQRLHQHKTEAPVVFEMLSSIASSQPPTVNVDNFEATITLANEFATAGSIGSMHEQRRDLATRRGMKAKPASQEHIDQVQRAIKAITIISSLSSLVPKLIEESHLERNEAWAAHWSPIFRSLSTQCVNPTREIRHRAISALQRTLLSEDLTLTEEDHHHKEWTAIFSEVLFPLVVRLLKPEVQQLDIAGMTHTRVQAATLLCKIFLKYLDDLVKCNEMLSVWTQVLGLLDRMMSAGVATKEGGSMDEAVGEGVKNVILVMAGAGYLVPPSTLAEDADMDEKLKKDKIEVWNETGKRVERFFPGMMRDLFPTPPPPPPSAPVQTEKEKPATPAGSAKPSFEVAKEESQIE